jgi:HSP20 family protein
MALETWRPFRDLEEVERFFEDWPFFRWRPWWPLRLRVGERAWAPALDLFDREDKLIVEAELPGVDKDTIDITVVGGVLHIRAERKPPANIKDEDYYCCERPRGSLYRTIQLPIDVDVDKIEAEYTDGILRVTLPKAPEVKPKKVSVTIK